MSAAATAAGSSPWWMLARRYGPLVLLLVATLGLGSIGQSVARPVFILGCMLVSWDMMRFSATTHFSGCFVLFCLAPFLRRVVDGFAGYEPSGLMISGPLLALLVPAPRLLTSLSGGRPIDPALRPILVCCACGFLGMVLTLIEGDLMQAASGAVKWLAPPIYGIWLFGEARKETGFAEAAGTVAMLMFPILGLYGFYQYVDPPIWDRYWMTYTTIASIGQPEPFMVRVFSTMNAPAGYATFAAAGLLLFGFRRRGWVVLLAAAPSMLGLLLSMYRTAWIGLAIGVLIGLFHPSTWRRATMLLVTVPILGAIAISFTPAGEALEQRLQSFTSVSEDASGQERLSEYSDLLDADGGTLIGHGFGNVDVMQAGSRALDGQFIVSWYTFGLVVAIIYVCAVIWAAWQGMRQSWRVGTMGGMAVSAVLASLVVQMPLAVISSSEIGFLFWSFAAIGAAARHNIGAAARDNEDLERA